MLFFSIFDMYLDGFIWFCSAPCLGLWPLSMFTKGIRFLALWKTEFWCPELAGRMYVGYYNLFPRLLPSSFTDPLPKSLPSCSFRFLKCIWWLLLGLALGLVLVCGPYSRLQKEITVRKNDDDEDVFFPC